MLGGRRSAGRLAVKPRPATADTKRVQITRKTKLYGGIGAGLVLVALVFKVLVLKGPAPVAAPPPVAHHALTSHRATRPAAKTHKPALLVIDSSLPAPLRTALRKHRVVVAVLYAPGSPEDALTILSGLAGAAKAHAGFAALNVRDEAVAEAMASKLPGSSDPSVLVVSRPGDIKFLISGFIDGDAVAQAVRAAR